MDMEPRNRSRSAPPCPRRGSPSKLPCLPPPSSMDYCRYAPVWEEASRFSPLQPNTATKHDASVKMRPVLHHRKGEVPSAFLSLDECHQNDGPFRSFLSFTRPPDHLKGLLQAACTP